MPIRDSRHAFRASVAFRSDGTAHIAVAGEVDYISAQRLDEALSFAMRRSGGDVVIDFGALTFAGAACVNVLVAARDQLGAEGRRFRLEHVPPRLNRLFALCGTYFLIAAPERSPRLASRPWMARTTMPPAAPS